MANTPNIMSIAPKQAAASTRRISPNTQPKYKSAARAGNKTFGSALDQVNAKLDELKQNIQDLKDANKKLAQVEGESKSLDATTETPAQGQSNTPQDAEQAIGNDSAVADKDAKPADIFFVRTQPVDAPKIEPPKISGEGKIPVENFVQPTLPAAVPASLDSAADAVDEQPATNFIAVDNSAYLFGANKDALLAPKPIAQVEAPKVDGAQNLMTLMPQAQDNAQSMLNLLGGRAWRPVDVQAQPLDIQPTIQAQAQPVDVQPTIQPQAQPVDVQPTIQAQAQPVDVQPMIQAQAQPLDVQPQVQAQAQPLDVQPMIQPQAQPVDVQPQVQAQAQPVDVQPTIQAQAQPVDVQPMIQPQAQPVDVQPTIQAQAQPVDIQPTIQAQAQPVDIQPTIQAQAQPVDIQPTIQAQAQPVDVQPTIQAQAQPVDVQPTIQAQAQPVDVQPTIQPQAQPVNIQPTIQAQAQPVDVQPTIQPQAQPVDVQPTIQPQAQPVDVQPTIQAQAQPVDVQPTIQAQAQPVDVQPTIQAQAQPVDVQPPVQAQAQPVNTQPVNVQPIVPAQAQPLIAPQLADERPAVQIFSEMLGVNVQVEDAPTAAPVTPPQQFNQNPQQQPQQQDAQNFQNQIFQAAADAPQAQQPSTGGEVFTLPLTPAADAPQSQPTTPAQAPDAPQPQPQEDFDVPAQIVRQARLIRTAENTEMVIKLNPEHLGELTLRVSVSANGAVNASFHSDNAQVRTIIENSLVMLKQELSNIGLKVENVDVYAGLSDGGLLGGQGGQAWQQGRQQRQGNRQVDLNTIERDLDATAPVNESTTDGVDYSV